MCSLLPPVKVQPHTHLSLVLISAQHSWIMMIRVAIEERSSTRVLATVRRTVCVESALGDHYMYPGCKEGNTIFSFTFTHSHMMTYLMVA